MFVSEASPAASLLESPLASLATVEMPGEGGLFVVPEGAFQKARRDFRMRGNPARWSFRGS